MKKMLFLLFLLLIAVTAIAEAPCPHESHSPDLGLCLSCGQPVFHAYVDGVCACGRAPQFYEDLLPSHMYRPGDQQGSVDLIDYTAWNYPYRRIATDKTFAVWTPYDYDPEIKYNVLILLHGGGDNFHAWIDQPQMADRIRFSFIDLYDNITREGKVAPFIVASIPARAAAEQIAGELRYDILPAIIARYSTWADSADEADIQAARDHFGLGGLSNGSVYTLTAGMGLCFDLFGNYMCLSANGQHRLVAERLNSPEYRDLPVHCFFASCGTGDSLSAQTRYGYQRICESLPRFVPGANAWHLDQRGGHDWKVWSTGVYNALQVMF